MGDRYSGSKDFRRQLSASVLKRPIASNVNGEYNGIASSRREHHELQVTPDRRQAAVCKLKLNDKPNIRVGT